MELFGDTLKKLATHKCLATQLEKHGPNQTFIIELTSEQRPPVNNDHYFWILTVVVGDRLGCA